MELREKREEVKLGLLLEQGESIFSKGNDEPEEVANISPVSSIKPSESPREGVDTAICGWWSWIEIVCLKNQLREDETDLTSGNEEIWAMEAC